MRRILVPLAAAAIVLTGTAIVLAAPAAAQKPAEQAGSRATREFVQAAGQSDAFEMLAADTALAQSTNPQVRAFAQQMLRDHGRTSAALQQATARAGLAPPPMQVGADQAPLLGALQSLKGAEFDQAYAHHQVLAHRSALTATQRYAAGGDDPAVRQAAGAAVPVIAAHLAAAERLAAALGGS